MFTPREIRDTEFERVSRGYKVEDVDGFLARLADQMEQLAAEKNDLNQKLQLLAEKVEQYRKDEDALRSALINAEKMKDTIIAEATQQQEIVLRDAQQKAEKIVADAEGKIDKEEVMLKALKQQVAAFKSEILNIYKAHLEILSDLPDEYMDTGEFEDQSVNDIFAHADNQAMPEQSAYAMPVNPAYAAPEQHNYEHPAYAMPEQQQPVYEQPAYAAIEPMAAPEPFAMPAAPMMQQQMPVSPVSNDPTTTFDPIVPMNNNVYDGFAPRAENQQIQPAADQSVFASFTGGEAKADGEGGKYGNLDFGENFSFGRD